MTRLIFFLFSLSLFISCHVGDHSLSPELVNTYQELLDGLKLDCPVDTSDQFFKATIAGQQACYYVGVDDRILVFGIATIFTTPSPSVTTGELPSDLRRGVSLGIQPFPTRQGEDHVDFTFPDFPIERDSIDYLDSIFAIEYHKVRSIFQVEDRFEVEFKLMRKRTEGGGNVYSISSRFGLQDGSYIRFRKVEKSVTNGVTSYDIEMEVECKLYHWPQYGKEGLWGRIENGLFVGTLVVD